MKNLGLRGGGPGAGYPGHIGFDFRPLIPFVVSSPSGSGDLSEELYYWGSLKISVWFVIVKQRLTNYKQIE